MCGTQHSENKMTTNTMLVFAAFVSTCGTTTSPYGSTQTSTGIYCEDYELMIQVDLDLADDCTTDYECAEILSGTGCGCPTDDRIASINYDTSFFYDMQEEAEGEGCSIDYETDCRCVSSAQPICLSGNCRWF